MGCEEGAQPLVWRWGCSEVGVHVEVDLSGDNGGRGLDSGEVSGTGGGLRGVEALGWKVENPPILSFDDEEGREVGRHVELRAQHQ